MNPYQKAYKSARRKGYTKPVAKILAEWESTEGQMAF